MKHCLAVVFSAAFAASAFCADGGLKSGATKTINLPGGVTMEMIWCEPGEFMMGSKPDEAGRFSDETLHKVTLRKGFWLGKYEVTQEQWLSVMKEERAKFQGEGLPQDSVSWDDCNQFIHRVNEYIGGGARLPTEAEWEYACRAGSDTPFSGGLTVEDVAWYAANSTGLPHKVGSKAPNAWGFYDMHGNLLEWCSDWYYKLFPTAVVDPKGSVIGSFKVLKGGCWFFFARDCRSAYRLKRDPEIRNCLYGFRLAMSPREEPNEN